MRHTLRKYLSNRGSALFMILSTMTALMISCTAMYFSVVSSRSTQYAIFYQQQSYQSAVSLADAIMASITSGQGGFTAIGNKILALNIGETITTGSNGYAAFAADGSGKEEDNQVGAYMLEATRLDDEVRADGTSQMMYDIVITASVNGKKEVYHNVFSMQAMADSPPTPTKPFTMTGYTGDPTHFQAGPITSDVILDAEHTVFKTYKGTGNSMTLKGNLACGGSLTINDYLTIEADGKRDFLVRGDFKSYTNTPLKFAEPTGTTAIDKNKSRSTVIIGGDCHLIDGASFENANVYILGDLIVKGNSFSTSCKYFVDGDIILEKGPYGGYWHNLSTVYCNGTVDQSKNTGGGLNGALAGRWNEGATGLAGNGLMTVDEMIDYLDDKTGGASQFKKWEVETTGLPEKTIHFDSTPSNPTPTQVLKYSETEKGCVIKDITMNNDHSSGGWKGNFTLVIDTGEDPENIYTIGLTANRVMEGDASGDKTVFCWFPRDITTGTTSKWDNMNMKFQILVMGRGSVVMKVPDGVVYQDDHEMIFQHYGWFVMNGGTEHYFGDPSLKSNRDYRIANTAYLYKGNSGSDMAFFSQFVHTTCNDGDGCTYTEFDSTEECDKCGQKMTEVHCSNHDIKYKYCPACKGAPDKHLCANYKEPKKIDQFLNNHPAMKERMKDSSGNVIYPNTNIFLVSCSENVDIRFSLMSHADPNVFPGEISENSFFGFIYAPYLIYKAQEDGGGNVSGGGYVKILGGMVVSGSVLEINQATLGCYPDKMPDEIMPEDSGYLPSLANKSWKVSLRAH